MMLGPGLPCRTSPITDRLYVFVGPTRPPHVHGRDGSHGLRRRKPTQHRLAAGDDLHGLARPSIAETVLQNQTEAARDVRPPSGCSGAKAVRDVAQRRHQPFDDARPRTRDPSTHEPALPQTPTSIRLRTPYSDELDLPSRGPVPRSQCTARTQICGDPLRTSALPATD